MEKTLKEIVREKGPVCEKKALEIIRQIVSHLLWAGYYNVIFKDLEPENIVVSANGTVKPLDASCQAREHIKFDSQYLSGLLFSLGHILIFLLTGKSIKEKGSQVDTYTHGQMIPSCTKALFKKMLQKEPASYIQSIQELLYEIDSCSNMLDVEKTSQIMGIDEKGLRPKWTLFFFLITFLALFLLLSIYFSFST